MRERARSLLDRFLEKWQLARREDLHPVLSRWWAVSHNCADVDLHFPVGYNAAGPMLEEGLLPGDVKFADCLVKGDFKVQKKYADHNNL